MSDSISRKEFSEKEKLVIEKMVEKKMWQYAHTELRIFWGVLQEYDEDWLVGENGIIYRLPPDVWHYLVTEIAERRLGDPLTDSAKQKILMRMKEDEKHRMAKEKEQRKIEKLSDRDRELVNKQLGFSNNSIFVDKRSTRAGNDPHGYFSSNY